LIAAVALFSAMSVLLPEGASGQAFELTAFAGARLGGVFEDGATGAPRDLDASASFGLVGGFPLGGERTLEFVWSHQEGRVAAAVEGGGPVELDLDLLTVGGTYGWVRPHTRPFVSSTAGVMLLSPETAGLDREALLALTIGGGVEVPLSARVALRFEGRGVLTLALGSVAGICGGGGCALGFSGAGVAQLEVLAGVRFRP
jgi:hypothetical protein